jgi:hypothetical protein
MIRENSFFTAETEIDDLNALEQAIIEICSSEMRKRLIERKKEIVKDREAHGIKDIIISDSKDILGIAAIKNFGGETMHINPVHLKRAFDIANVIFDDEYRNDVEIGINKQNPGGTFFLFLNEKKEAAIVVAGKLP